MLLRFIKMCSKHQITHYYLTRFQSIDCLLFLQADSMGGVYLVSWQLTNYYLPSQNRTGVGASYYNTEFITDFEMYIN